MHAQIMGKRDFHIWILLRYDLFAKIVSYIKFWNNRQNTYRWNFSESLMKKLSNLDHLVALIYAISSSLFMCDETRIYISYLYHFHIIRSLQSINKHNPTYVGRKFSLNLYDVGPNLLANRNIFSPLVEMLQFFKYTLKNLPDAYL